MSYGLLGRTLGHSFSPQIHAQIADYDYRLYEVEPEDIPAFFAEGDWQGINVTIPYKETVLPFCDEVSEQARRIGCVNTLVRRADGTLFGTNTDYDGLAYALDSAGIKIAGKKCLVLGNGATSKTVCTVLADKGAQEIVVFGRHARDKQDIVPYSDIALHHDAEVIVNATPVGMYPNNGARLIDLDGFAHLEACFDVIYNPHRSQFLLDAERRGVITCDGLPMLVAQAVYAAVHFIGLADPAEKIAPILAKMRADDENIVLIGMPGVGKTTIGEALAAKLGRSFVDIDSAIEEKYGSVPDYINNHGVDAFRAVESETIAEIGKQHGLVIATGGGSPTIPANKDLLRQNGRIYWLTRALEELPTDGRPLSAGGIETLRRLFDERKSCYADFADVTIANDDVDTTVSQILEDFHEAMHH